MWTHYLAWFLGALFLTNAMPHLFSAQMGRPFQTPFANPPGQGLSSSTVNAVWGITNVVIGYLLLWHVGSFDLHDFSHAATAGAALALGSLFHARRFGRFHGGLSPERSTP